MTLDDAIAKIDSREQAFCVHSHCRMVGVIVAVSPSGKKYLKVKQMATSRIVFYDSRMPRVISRSARLRRLLAPIELDVGFIRRERRDFAMMLR